MENEREVYNLENGAKAKHKHIALHYLIDSSYDI